MLEWLVVWGVGQSTWSVFHPILVDLAKDVVKDAAKSYVGECFKSVFSVVRRDTLTKATGLALRELLELIEGELIRADIDENKICDWIDDVNLFTKHDKVKLAIASLFLQPGYQIDPNTFAAAWQQVNGTRTLPNSFSWQFVAKRFAGKTAEIRQSTVELRETFDSLAKVRSTDALQELAGLPPDFDLETYREALFERHRNLDFGSLDTTGAYYNDVQLWNVFVPQSVRECHDTYPQPLELPKEYFQHLLVNGEPIDGRQTVLERNLEDRRREYLDQPLQSVLDILDDTRIKRAVILGDPGSGKSSLLRFLALRWARNEDTNLRYTQPLPLLIELRDYNRWICLSGKSFTKYLHEASTWHRLNQQTLDQLLKQQDRVVLLLDGLDEVFDPVQREQVVNDIHRFSTNYKHVRIITTSRVVGYQPQRLRDAEFRHFMLQDFSSGTAEKPGQIDHFLNSWHGVMFNDATDGELKRERLSKAINSSKPIAMLAGNPLLLTMMAILNRHQELPRNRVDLYQQATRVLLQQWDTERALEEYPELRGEVDLRAKTAILRSVAIAMQNGPQGLAGNVVSGETLTTLIENYLREELHFYQPRAAASALVRQLRERNFILCFLGAESYAFVHRTFLEYFCAADFERRFNFEKTLNINGLIAEFENHCQDDDWREVLRLVCGQIDEQFVNKIVNMLSERTDLKTWNGYDYLHELMLAGYCLSEVRNPKNSELIGKQLLEKYVLTLRHANSSKSSNYPRPLLQEIVAVSSELGLGWPGRDQVDLSSVPEFIASNVGDKVWASFVANLTADNELIRKLLVFEQTGVRIGAIEALAENWPDQTTRKLLEEIAVQDLDEYPRQAALYELAESWPDHNTRNLLEERAIKDESVFARMSACLCLVKHWPDEATRKLLEDLIIQDNSEIICMVCVVQLGETWPDDATRKLIELQAVHGEAFLVRGAALKMLPEIWPDDATRKLLEECAIQDENHIPHAYEIRSLAMGRPDDASLKLLEEWAIQDEKLIPHAHAIKALAMGKPDDASRKLLKEWKIQSEKLIPHSHAITALAKSWPDNTTRMLLEERAVQDEGYFGRTASIKSLAEIWPDDATRGLLVKRAVQDTNEYTRESALKALAKSWPDHTTRKLLKVRAVQDTNIRPREAAFKALAEIWPEDITLKLLEQLADSR